MKIRRPILFALISIAIIGLIGAIFVKYTYCSYGILYIRCPAMDMIVAPNEG